MKNILSFNRFSINYTILKFDTFSESTCCNHDEIIEDERLVDMMFIYRKDFFICSLVDVPLNLSKRQIVIQSLYSCNIGSIRNIKKSLVKTFFSRTIS